MISRRAIACAALMGANAILSSAGFAGEGKAGAAFLRIPVGARAVALGEAATVSARGAEALFWNPAGMGGESSVDFVLNHQPVLDFINYDVAGAVWSNGHFATGLGVARLSQKDLDVLDLSGTKVRSASAFDQQVVLGGSARKNRWAVGIAAKFIESKLDDASASAIAGDVGVKFPGFSRHIDHAVTIQNIGSSISFDSESSSLPMMVRAGTELKFKRTTLEVDAVKPNEGELYFAAGGEMRILATKSFAMKLRSGYRSEQNDQGDLAGFSLGSGLEMGSFRLDYAWRPNGEFTDGHNISVGYTMKLLEPGVGVGTKKVIYEKNEKGRFRLPPLKK